MSDARRRPKRPVFAGEGAQPRDAGLPDRELRLGADDHAVLGGVHAQDVEALRRRDLDPASLTDGVAVVPGVLAHALAGRVLDRARAGRQGHPELGGVPRDELARARPRGNEADFLALFLVGRGQLGAARVRADLDLGHRADGEARRRELLRRQIPEEVRLVLVGVRALAERRAVPPHRFPTRT